MQQQHIRINDSISATTNTTTIQQQQQHCVPLCSIPIIYIIINSKTYAAYPSLMPDGGGGGGSRIISISTCCTTYKQQQQQRITNIYAATISQWQQQLIIRIPLILLIPYINSSNNIEVAAIPTYINNSHILCKVVVVGVSYPLQHTQHIHHHALEALCSIAITTQQPSAAQPAAVSRISISIIIAWWWWRWWWRRYYQQQQCMCNNS